LEKIFSGDLLKRIFVFVSLFILGIYVVLHQVKLSKMKSMQAELSKMKSMFEALKSKAVEEGDLNLCVKIKTIAEENLKESEKLPWDKEYYNPCIKEVAIYREDEKMCKLMQGASIGFMEDPNPLLYLYRKDRGKEKR
jgi:hypothetical protein